MDVWACECAMCASAVINRGMSEIASSDCVNSKYISRSDPYLVLFWTDDHWFPGPILDMSKNKSAEKLGIAADSAAGAL